MKKCLFVITLLIIMSFTLTLFGRSNGKISVLLGKVYIMEYRKAYKKSLLTANKTISPKDIILTTSNGIVIVRFPDKSSIIVRPNSRVQFSFMSTRSQMINLGNGGVMARVNRLRYKKGFNVNTPNSLAGVRGTQFIVEYNENSKEYNVDVYSGRVNYKPKSKKNRVTLNLDKGNALHYDNKKLSSVRISNKETLKKYEEFMKKLSSNISGWEFN